MTIMGIEASKDFLLLASTLSGIDIWCLSPVGSYETLFSLGEVSDESYDYQDW